ncbi:MAG: methyltransferase domain-containing protein [Saprospiraceae bacterium]
MTDLQKRIVSYYDNTWLDYRVLWINKKDRALHFGYYDTFKESHSEALEKMNQVMAGEVDIKPSDMLLDAGCGQGGSALWLAKHIGCTVKGVTLVPHQAAVANREANERGLNDKAQFSVQDYANTNFEDESFSVIWACESLCHAPSKKSFYDEAFRLLKPGGRLIVAEYIRYRRDYPTKDEAILQDWCSGWSMPDLDTWSEHQRHLIESGFTSINEKDITKHVTPSLHRLFRMSKTLLKMGKFLNFTKIRNDIKHHNQLASMSQYEALTKNLWYYCIYSAAKPIVPS